VAFETDSFKAHKNCDDDVLDGDGGKEKVWG